MITQGRYPKILGHDSAFGAIASKNEPKLISKQASKHARALSPRIHRHDSASEAIAKKQMRSIIPNPSPGCTDAAEDASGFQKTSEDVR